MPVFPIKHFDWQVLRTVKRSKKPPTGQLLRLVPTRRTKDGSFLTEMVECGLLRRVTGEPADGPVAQSLFQRDSERLRRTDLVAVSLALSRGSLGLAGGISLAELLKTHSGVRNKRSLLKLTKAQILAWADDYYQKTGKWPQCRSGAIAAAPSETWMAVPDALKASVVCPAATRWHGR